MARITRLRSPNLAAWPALRALDWNPVAGRRFCVHVRDMGLRVQFSVHAKGFRAERQGPADVTFTATAHDLARLALRLEDPDTLFFNRRLLIEGDTDLGLIVKNMLVRWSWRRPRPPCPWARAGW